jgi:hypothetical protein
VPRKVNRGFAAPDGGVTSSVIEAGENGDGLEEYGIVTVVSGQVGGIAAEDVQLTRFG